MSKLDRPRYFLNKPDAFDLRICRISEIHSIFKYSAKYRLVLNSNAVSADFNADKIIIHAYFSAIRYLMVQLRSLSMWNYLKWHKRNIHINFNVFFWKISINLLKPMNYHVRSAANSSNSKEIK